MNTDLDGPLSVWFGRAMFFAGIFGVSLPFIYSAGINLIPGINDSSSLGLGSIIASIGLGIGGAFLFKTRQYKKIKKERKIADN